VELSRSQKKRLQIMRVQQGRLNASLDRKRRDQETERSNDSPPKIRGPLMVGLSADPAATIGTAGSCLRDDGETAVKTVPRPSEAGM